MSMKTKGLLEKRAANQEAMNTLLNNAKIETRALTEDEAKTFDDLEKEINEIDATIAREQRAEALANERTVSHELSDEEADCSAFAEHIRSFLDGYKTRSGSATNLTTGDNGAVIPKTIINKIVTKVNEISPVYNLATHYNAKGTVAIPVEDESTDSITCSYATEFNDTVSHASKTTSIQLTGFLYSSLAKISKSLLSNSDIDLVGYVVNRMAQKIAKWMEGECLNGTADKVIGIKGSYDSTNMKITLAANNDITADELIDLQDLVPDCYSENAIWIMNNKTRKAIRKLKDGEGQYLLSKDLTSPWGYSLLGKPVFCSKNAKEIKAANAGEICIFYGDMSGLAIKESQKTEIQVLKETFATQNALGVVAWGELDAKIENKQKIACAVIPS